MNKDTYMRISECEKLSGVPKTTIRFYVEQGLLPAPVKTGRTMAYYDERHIRLLKIIQKVQKDESLPLSRLKKRLSSYNQNGVRAPSQDFVISSEEKKKKRYEILRTATKVFSEKGYHRTTVQDITSEANISTGTFYFYFNDKHQLYNDVVNDLIIEISREREKVLNGETDLLTRVIKRGQAIYEQFDKYKEIILLVRAEMGGENKWAQKKAAELYQSLSGSLEADLNKAVEKGLIRKIDPKLASYSLIGLIEIMVLFMKLESGYDINQILSFLTDFVLKGLEPRSTALLTHDDIINKSEGKR